ncbi:unnamed protein product, partial [marine sediment metagenome]
MSPEIQRFCWFDTVPISNTIWKHKRAIEGHKLVLVDVSISIEYVHTEPEQFFQIYNGSVWSVWGSFPNIFDQSTLAQITLSTYSGANHQRPLHDWECKEFTMSMRNTDSEGVRRFCAIVWFYEVPM